MKSTKSVDQIATRCGINVPDSGRVRFKQERLSIPIEYYGM